MWTDGYGYKEGVMEKKYKVKINLGDNRECETSICKKCKKTMYDEIWYSENGCICKECLDKGYMWRNSEA